MKQFRILFFLAATIVTISSCSKKTDDGGGSQPPKTDLNIALKNTVWSGEFQYTSQVFSSNQPFSIQLADDGTVTWSDIESTRPGGKWVAKNDTLTITFPNNTAITAIVDGDIWHSFGGAATSGVQVNNVSRTTVPDVAAITNTSFTGSYNETKLILQFIAGQKLKYTLGASSALTVGYTVEGAGIRCNLDAGILTKIAFFGIFQAKNTSMKNIDRWTSGFPSKINYYTWTGNKQQL